MIWALNCNRHEWDALTRALYAGMPAVDLTFEQRQRCKEAGCFMAQLRIAESGELVCRHGYNPETNPIEVCARAVNKDLFNLPVEPDTGGLSDDISYALDCKRDGIFKLIRKEELR